MDAVEKIKQLRAELKRKRELKTAIRPTSQSCASQARLLNDLKEVLKIELDENVLIDPKNFK